MLCYSCVCHQDCCRILPRDLANAKRSFCAFTASCPVLISTHHKHGALQSQVLAQAWVAAQLLQHKSACLAQSYGDADESFPLILCAISFIEEVRLVLHCEILWCFHARFAGNFVVLCNLKVPEVWAERSLLQFDLAIGASAGTQL